MHLRQLPAVWKACASGFCCAKEAGTKTQIHVDRLILRELDYVKGKQTRVAANQYLDAEEDSDDILACYRRIQGHLQRLSASCAHSHQQNA